MIQGKKTAMCCSLLQHILGKVSSWILKPEGFSYLKLWCFDYLCQKVPSQPVLCKIKLFCTEPENFQVLHLTLGLYSVLLPVLEKGAAVSAEGLQEHGS